MARKGYVQLVNGFYMNWKARKLRVDCPSALGVFAMTLSYCGDNLTDGYISGNELKYVIGATETEINALCSVEMLIRSDDGAGYTVHDYLKHNRSNEQVTKKRASDSASYRRKKTVTGENLRQTSDSDVGIETESEVLDEKVRETSDSVVGIETESGQTPEHQNTRTPVKKEKTSSFPEKKSRKTRIRPTFTLDAESVAYAKRLKLDPKRERDRFVDHWLADGGSRADWQALFRGWCDHSPDAKPPAKPEPPSENWLQRHVLEWVPGPQQLQARKRFFQVLSDSGDRDLAARTIAAEFKEAE